MRRPNLRQLMRHFIWWCVALVIVPFIVIFASVIARSETITHIGLVLLFWLGYPLALVLGHPVFDPALKTIPTGAPPIVILLAFWAVVCLFLAAVSAMLANRTFEGDARKSGARPSM